MTAVIGFVCDLAERPLFMLAEEPDFVDMVVEEEK